MKNLFHKKMTRNDYQRMKTLGSITIVSLCFILSMGNLNRNDLNEIAIVYSLGIDWEDDQYKVSMQVINPPNLHNPSDKLPVIVYEEKSKSFGKAIEMVSKKIPRELNLSQVQLIIVGKTLAEKKGIDKVLNYVLREPGLSSMMDILISENITAYDALQVISVMEDIPSSEIVKTLKNTEENWGSHQQVLPTKLKGNILSKEMESIVPTIILKGNNKDSQEKTIQEQPTSKAFLELSGLTVFKGDKIVGKLDDNQSRSYYLVKGSLKNSYFSAPCSKNTDEEYGLNIIKSKTTIHGEVKNNKPNFKINTEVVGDLDELNCAMDLTTPNGIKKIEASMEKEIVLAIEDLINQSKQLNSDIIGFGEVLRIEDNENWKKIKSKWKDDIYATSNIEIKVKTIIRNFGDTNLTK